MVLILLSRLTFNTDRDGNQEIYIMDASGNDLVNVTNTPYIEGLADWSPDGMRLVLYSEQKKDKDVYILDLATGQWTNITNSPYSDEYCAWWP
jgi:TolB protein